MIQRDLITIGPLTLISTKDMPRQTWLDHRQNGLGGSDMGTIMHYNKNFPATELFYQKVGLHNSSDEENESMFWGTENEPAVLDKGQYLNLEDQTYMQAKREGRKLRNISHFKYMAKNSNYNWLIGNVDGLVNLSMRWLKADMVAEAKTISRQSAEMWKSIPIYHFFQCQLYPTLLAPMLRKQESIIFYLEDGRKFSGWSIPIIPDMRDRMLQESYDFWQRVLKGREVVANEPNIDKQLMYLSEFEPEVEGTPAYYEFLSELFKLKESFVHIQANEEDVSTVKRYLNLKKEINTLEAKRQLEKNKIMKRLHDNGANIIQFEQGKVTYNKKLYVNVSGEEEEA